MPRAILCFVTARPAKGLPITGQIERVLDDGKVSLQEIDLLLATIPTCPYRQFSLSMS